MIRKHIVMAAILMMVGGAAMSAEAAGPIVRRQVNQQRRIGQGLRSGQLTGPEAARLELREARLARDIARMRASGGGLDGRERARIHICQDNLSRAIYRQKHDAQVRPGR